MRPESHTKVSKNIAIDLKNKGINISEKRMIWASIYPDIAPLYIFGSHYLEGSISFITNEIGNLIYLLQFIDPYSMQGFQRKIISCKMGVISHYLADYTTLPHAKEWTFYNNKKRHISYENQLKRVSDQHRFKKIDLETPDVSELENFTKIKIKEILEENIRAVIKEYEKEESMERDLDFAYNLGGMILAFSLELAAELKTSKALREALVY